MGTANVRTEVPGKAQGLVGVGSFPLGVMPPWRVELVIPRLSFSGTIWSFAVCTDPQIPVSAGNQGALLEHPGSFVRCNARPYLGQGSLSTVRMPEIHQNTALTFPHWYQWWVTGAGAWGGRMGSWCTLFSWSERSGKNKTCLCQPRLPGETKSQE